jgi:hypothetical protein
MLFADSSCNRRDHDDLQTIMYLKPLRIKLAYTLDKHHGHDTSSGSESSSQCQIHGSVVVVVVYFYKSGIIEEVFVSSRSLLEKNIKLCRRHSTNVNEIVDTIHSVNRVGCVFVILAQGKPRFGWKAKTSLRIITNGEDSKIDFQSIRSTKSDGQRLAGSCNLIPDRLEVTMNPTESLIGTVRKCTLDSSINRSINFNRNGVHTTVVGGTSVGVIYINQRALDQRIYTMQEEINEPSYPIILDKE